eukprot:scaffold544_cov320-Pavlova_lutheri.AAC.4
MQETTTWSPRAPSMPLASTLPEETARASRKGFEARGSHNKNSNSNAKDRAKSWSWEQSTSTWIANRHR